MAEAIFNHHVKELGFHHLSDSCGTANYHVGDLPDPRTVSVVKEHGVSIQHYGRQLSIEDFDRFDLILAMDSSNHSDILRIGASAHRDKVKLMREFDPEGNGDVPDPYYGGPRDFKEVYDILNRSIKNLLQSL
jgi:protein-tyrosine phosphatase